MSAIHRFFPGVKEDAQIIILDCGSKSAPAFAEFCREFGVCTYTVSTDIFEKHTERFIPKGVIISGGPDSVYDPDALQIPYERLMYLRREQGTKILATCYGAQALVYREGGKVQRAPYSEVGIYDLRTTRHMIGSYHGGKVVMNHRDEIISLPFRWECWGFTEQSAFALFGTDGIMCTLFHPEMDQTEHTGEIMRHFLFTMARCEQDHVNDPDAFVANAVSFIRRAVPEGNAVVGVSGGVDSCVTHELFRLALGQDRVWGIFVDNGFMRRDEPGEVRRLLGEHHMIYDYASPLFYAQIEQVPWVGRSEEEYFKEVRTKIGHVFFDVFGTNARRLPGVIAVGQGTNDSDRRETETNFVQHHNLAVPEDQELDIVEPLAGLHKHEIRQIGAYLGLHPAIVWRQPSPGPGNAVRMPMPVTRQKAETLAVANRILHERILFHYPDPIDRPAQYWAGLRPGKVRMLVGDKGSYDGCGLEIRAVKANARENYVTADIFYFSEHVWRDIDACLRREVRGPDGETIAVVSYLGTPKPSLPIELQ